MIPSGLSSGAARRGVKRWIKESEYLRYVRLLQPETRIWGREAGALPEFLIIGAQRSGSTFLHDTFVQETNARCSPLQKEVHYFDNKYYRGLDWYAKFFKTCDDEHQANFETSPYYLYHPAVPGRIQESLPDVKVIAVLRDPVERAVSQYKWIRERELETRGAMEAFQYDAERLHLEGDPAYLERFEDPLYFDFDHMQRGYLRRSLYDVQLQRWREHVPPSRIRVVRSAMLFNGTSRVLDELIEFLDLERERTQSDADESVNQNASRAEIAVPQEARDIAGLHLEGVGKRTREVLTDEIVLGGTASLDWA